MIYRVKLIFPLLTCSFLIILGCGSAEMPDALASIDDARLRNAADDEANWLTYGRTYDEHRFSPLQQINDETVGDLGLAWSSVPHAVLRPRRRS